MMAMFAATLPSTPRPPKLRSFFALRSACGNEHLEATGFGQQFHQMLPGSAVKESGSFRAKLQRDCFALLVRQRFEA